MRNNRRHYRVVADEVIDENLDQIDDMPAEDDAADEAQVDVAPEATELLFEAEDVAELIAEVTGSDVEVTVDEDTVKFTVDDVDYTVAAEGDEEILESSRIYNKKSIKASVRRPVKSSTQPAPKRAVSRPAAPAAPAQKSVRRVSRTTR